MVDGAAIIDIVHEKTGYLFSREAFLLEAMTHPSAVKEGRSAGPDNQRLEYLGDAVLQLAVSHMLLLRFPASNEGELSFLRAEMVRRENLAEVSAVVGIADLVLAGPSLESAPDVARDTVAADALEALIGAVYLDGGWDPALEFVERHFSGIPEPGRMLKGAKSSLQEIIQGRFGGDVPDYQVVEDPACASDTRFLARVYHRGRFLGEGIGRSKKRAEEAAAHAALEKFEVES